MTAPVVNPLAVMAQDAYDADAYRGAMGAGKASRTEAKAASEKARAAVAELVELVELVAYALEQDERGAFGITKQEAAQRIRAALLPFTKVQP